MQGGDIEHFGIIDKPQFTLKLRFHRFFLFLIEMIPFIDGNNQGTPATHNFAQQMRILIGHPFMRIQHQHHHIGALNRFQGFDNGEFFHLIGHARLAANAGGINQGKYFAIAIHIGHINGIARRSRHRTGHQTFFANQAVNQRGFTRIGTPDNGERNSFGGGQCRFILRKQELLFRQLGNDIRHHVPKFGRTTAMLGSNGNNRLHAKGVKIGENHIGIGKIGFVHGENHWFHHTAQFMGNLLIHRRQTIATINHKNHHIRFFNRGTRLMIHAKINFAFFFAQQTASVNDPASEVAQLGFAILTVAS